MDKVLPQAYEGRPQAYIKHQLLQSYLQKLFLLVGAGGQELCYVDCFAGPWGDESGGMSSTSIGISLAVLNECREILGARGAHPRVRALYVENDPIAFARLSDYLRHQSPSRVDADCRRGDFVTLRLEILDWIGENAFVFFFIDPTGWKEIGIPTLRMLLERPSSEFLINFMYNDINRTMSMAEWQPKMRDLLGESIDLEMLPPEERERRILTTYRASCKSCMPSRATYPSRSGYVRVMDPIKNRPKYHLVYLTTHPRGIVEFMQISQGVDFTQRQVRAELKQAKREKKAGMMELFAAASQVGRADGRAGAEDVDTFWRNYLIAGGGKRRVGLNEFADILERTDWFPDDLQASLVRMIDAREVRNLNAARRRPKKPLHFDADWGLGESLQMEGYS